METQKRLARLNEKFVKGLEHPPRGHRIIYDEDLRGFGIRVTAKAKAFVLDYRFADPDDLKSKSGRYRYTIGQFGERGWSVAAARSEAKAWRRKIDRGTDHPMAHRTERRETVKARREAETFKQAVDDYIHRYQKGQKGNSTAYEVERALNRECADWLDHPITVVQTEDIQRLLEEMRDGSGDNPKPRPYLANRVFAYLRTFFAWSSQRGINKITDNPMQGLQRPWDGEESRDRIFTDDEIKALWQAADTIGNPGGPFLKLALITGKRKGKLSSMRWEEIDESWTWTPPQDTRRKKGNKRAHAIPLPVLAQRILTPLKPAEDDEQASPFVFKGRRRGTHLDPGTPLQTTIKEKSGIDDFFFHACKHTVETRMAELRISSDVRDLLLDHAPRRGTGQRYDHYLYAEDMTEALEKWCAEITRLVSPEGVEVLR
ncbi:tyrosine-type recombinase/integrase [Fodinicurvata fenggangensis]|uniref:tyrosine-type recombinase/integrase n=1 Tax=Fodinicurvata fenggangensis TaxID=1121830 RepID=UPI0005518E67|nr:integrase family protein [Fodinicurvata fenggangensis]